MLKRTAKVRQANLMDIMALAQLAEAYSEEAPHMKLHKLDVQTLMESFFNTILSDTGYLSVLEVDNKVVGGMWGLLTNMPWSKVKLTQDIILFVHKDYRGSGGLLVDDWVNWSLEKGAEEVILSTASGIKPGSFGKLMERKGFKLQGYTYSKEL